MRARPVSRRPGPALALLAPSLLGVLAFAVVPLIVVVGLSFADWDLLGPVRSAGLDNWRAVFEDDAFAHSLLVTVVFTAVVVPVQAALGFLVALPLARRFPGRGLVRTVYALPWMCAPLAVGVIWQWIFAPTGGALDEILGHRVEWLSDPALALPAVMLVSVWTYTGYVALFYAAGLRAIDPDLLDAASLDGASGWQRSRWIVLPLLRPTTVFVLITGALTALQTFDTVYALTRGGPGGATDVVGMRIYSTAFDAAQPGRAAVMAIVVFAITLVLAAAQYRFFRPAAGDAR